MWVKRSQIKPYNRLQLLTAPLIGGPLAVGILLFKNHKLHPTNKIAPALVVASFIYTFIIFAGLLIAHHILPFSISYASAPILYFALPYALLLFFSKQGTFFGRNGKYHTPSNGQVILKSVCCLCVNFALLLILMISTPF